MALTLITASGALQGGYFDITPQIPEISAFDDRFEKISDVAQYKEADWSNVIGIAKEVSVKEAKEIADSHPEITYFFYVKGYGLLLEQREGTYYFFDHGDAVFFSGTPWWGSAAGLADGYIKK